MEYLMTYGWAILIIAIVLGVLYYLGVFNSATLAPRAQPGSCQVFRPNGAGTSFDIGLEGTCNDELPEYVAQFSSASSSVTIPNSPSLSINGPFTVSLWFSSLNPYTSSISLELFCTRTEGEDTLDIQLHGNDDAYSINGIHGDLGTGSAWLSTSVNYAFNFAQNNWYNVVESFTSNEWSIYLNGVNVASGAYSSNTPSLLGQGSYISLGLEDPGSCGPSGNSGISLANVQVYNTSLSQAEITALYDEGIGGAPIKPQNITGWWPLNGNAQDYSGDLNNGVANSVTYTSAWTSGYTAP